MSELWFRDGELLCPCCRPVDVVSRKLSLATEGRLRCEWCEHQQSSVNGVAVLLPPNLMDTDQGATIEAFSRKWDFDPEAVREERGRVATEWFMRRFAPVWSELDDFMSWLRKHVRILDAGCGLGHLTTLMAKLVPHAEVWGIDLSTAVLKIQRESNMRLVRGDLTDVPVVGLFDLIVSDGVLHHTPNTKKSMLALASRLAPGGDFLFHVYKKKAPIREFADDFIREVMSRMSFNEAIDLCRSLVDIGRQLREAKVEIVIDRDIPTLGIESGAHDLQRFIYWHFLKCFWDDGGNVPASVIENYDWYAPKLAWRHTEEEVRSWFDTRAYTGAKAKSLGLELVWLGVDESGISVHARRM